MLENSAATPSRWLPGLLAIAIFMQMLDATILNTSLPVMAEDLQVSPLNMQSAIIAYALTLALLMPLSGYLCDRFGTRRVFSSSLLLFVIGSLLCAAAPNLSMLVIARIVQGTGGAMLLPVPRLVIMRAYDKTRLLHMMNYMVIPALIGPVLGPLLGGYLVEYTSWHWIFLINVPIGVAGIALTGKVMPDFSAEKHSLHLDIVGFLLFASGALGLSLAIETLNHPNGHLFSLLCGAGGMVSLLVYVRYARRHQDALYTLSLFQVRTYRLGLSGNLLSRLGMSSVPFLLPLLLQVVFNYSAALSGWMLAPIAVAAMFGKAMVEPLMRHFGYRRVLVFNTRIIGVLIMALALPSAHTPLWQILALLIVMGICNSIQFSAMNTLTIADLRNWQAGSGNSLLAVNQQLSISFGIALGAMILTGFRSSTLTHHNLHLAFQLTFLVIGFITFASGWVFTRLHVRDGDNLVAPPTTPPH